MKLNRNIKIFINYFLGPLLFLWLSWSIYRQIQRQPNLEKAWQRIRDSMSGPLLWNLVGALVLMVLNWSIEALKWRMSVKSIQQVSFIKAFKAVLSGVSFSVSTPNRIGEYLGRVLYMEEGNRLKTISTTVVGSMSQLIITLWMGFIGLIVLRPNIEAAGLISPLWYRVIHYGVIATLLLLLFFYFRLSWLVKWVDRLPGTRRFAYLFQALQEFDTGLLLKLLSLSMLRFVIFILQYYLLLRLFNVDVSWSTTFWSVSVSFLVLAAIPTFAIAELGVRGEVSLKLIGLFSLNNLGILMTALTIWLINLIIPAVAGSIFILSIRKIFRSRGE
jgi:hypothetical protein